MLVRTRKLLVLGAVLLIAVVISQPVASYSATSPTVTVLSPLSQGLRAPVKIALDASGNMYVADGRAGGVVVFDAYGKPLMKIRTAAVPNALAFAQDGSLLVAQSNFVARYNAATGEEVGRLTGGNLRSASGIAVNSGSGYLYVADSSAKQIEVYTASGQYVTAFGNGVLSTPTGVTFEKISGQLAVADTYNNKIQFFDVNGNYTFVRSIGNPIPSNTATVSALQFSAPVAVAFEYSPGQTPLLARIYVLDAYQGNVQVIDPATLTAINVAGAATNYIGTSGTLLVPSDAIFDATNRRLLVVNGFGYVTIYGIDGGKNPVYVDVTAPVFTVNQLPEEVTVNALTISGTVEAGSTVQISTGSAVVGSVTYTGSSWSAGITALAAGVNNFNVTAKDVAGNIAAPQSVSVAYLLPAPVLTVAAISSIIKSPVITISGAVDAGSVVVVTNLTTAVVGNATVTGSAWSFDAALGEGSNNLKVSAQKPQSAVANLTVAITLDTVAPALSVSALPNGSNAGDPIQNISGTVVDTSSTSLTVNGTAAVLNGNAFSVPVTLLNGPNNISVVAMDAAGNTTVNNRTLNYYAGSGLAVSTPVDNSITASATAEISGTVAGSLTVAVSGVPVTIQDNTWSTSVELTAGTNTIEIIATDAVGNSSSVKRTITLDTIKPALAVTSPTQDVAINVPNVLISGTVSDTTSLSLEYSVNGSAAAVPVSGGIYSFNVDFAAEGNYPVTITAKDAAGNSSTVVRNVIYDITPPTFSLNTVTGVMPEKLSGTVEAGSSVVVKDGTSPVGTVSVTNGAWTANLAGVTYTPGNLLVVATDAAGNSTSKSLTYSFPDGTLNAGGQPTVQDALRAIRLVVNQVTPSAQELAHYDIGPLVGGKPNPNGKIEIVDAILILRKALGLKSW